MPSMSLPQHPQILQGVRGAVAARPQPSPGAAPQMPSSGAGGAIGGGNPFQNVPGPQSLPTFSGAPNPGPFAQPAAFTPFLAPTLLSQAGGMGGGMGAGQGAPPGPPSSGQRPLGPVGGFGVGASSAMQPRPRNPYVAGFANK